MIQPPPDRIERVSESKPNTTLPATFGGPGWSLRSGSHLDDLYNENVWPKCGVNTEWSPLKQVLLSWPSAVFSKPDNPEAHLMLSWPELEILEQQCLATQAFFESRGVSVHLHRPNTPPPPNYLFMRDLVFMTPQGAILARPASPIRAAEARFAQAALATAGIPIIEMIRGNAIMEGADCLWISPDTVLVGTGTRTNAEAVDALKRVLDGMNVQTHSVPLPPAVQHLLGVILMLDRDLAAVDAGRVTPEIENTLSQYGIQTIAIPPSHENQDRRGMNGVTLGPREVVIPADCPAIAQQMQDAGVHVHTLDVSAYIQAAGALGCMTAILERELSI